MPTPQLELEPKVLDPVCGMSIFPSRAAGHLEHGGQTYYFCGRGCLEKFRAAPEKYLKATAIRPPAAPAQAPKSGDTREYTCPMDPDVRQIGPGACPKCGMALEPVSAAPMTKTEWTCPMHPEIVRDGPGSCPICGMALEPRVVTLDDRNPELDDMTRRFRWSLVADAAHSRIHGVRGAAGAATAARTAAVVGDAGRSSCSRRPSCSGAAGRSSSAAGRRS